MVRDTPGREVIRAVRIPTAAARMLPRKWCDSSWSSAMETRIDEVADRIYRLSTCVADAAPGGFTFNQFLIDADEPMLFHTGLRGMFPLVRAAIETVMPIDRLRWIGFGHVEADECGAMNALLAAAPAAQVAHGALGCMVSLDDLCDRPPRRLAALQPQALALMHGSSTRSRCGHALEQL